MSSQPVQPQTPARRTSRRLSMLDVEYTADQLPSAQKSARKAPKTPKASKEVAAAKSTTAKNKTVDAEEEDEPQVVVPSTEKQQTEEEDEFTAGESWAFVGLRVAVFLALCYLCTLLQGTAKADVHYAYSIPNVTLDSDTLALVLKAAIGIKDNLKNAVANVSVPENLPDLIRA